MKQFLILITIVIACSFSSKAQYITIPDQDFRHDLMQKYPSCFNASEQMDTTCSAILNETSYSITVSLLNWEGFQYFRNLQYATFAGMGSYQNSLPILPATLKYLYVWCNIDSLPVLPPTLISLDISEDLLSHTLPTLPLTLEVLKLVGLNSSITSIPALPNSLKHLEIDNYGDFATLPVLPAGLKHFTLTHSPSLTSLPSLPASLDTLVFTYGGISSLPALPASLKKLDCYRNQLTSVPVFPTQIEYVDLGYNNISSLPPLSATNLNTLLVSNNQLTSIPAIPVGLLNLEFGNNQVSDYPVLPSTLRYLGCAGNQLSSIPTLPDSLRYFNCSANQLTSIPGLPIFLEWLDCSTNQISALPPFPEKLSIISCQNNNIVCMPVLHNLYPNTLVINFDDEIACVPNIPYLTTEFIVWHNGLPITGLGDDTYTLCSAINNINHCDAFPLMTGHVYYDNNNNGIKDVNEPYRANVKVQMSDGSYTFTNSTGYYQIATSDTGSFSISTTEAPVYFATVPSQYNFHFNSYDTLVVSDFGFQATATIDSLGISLNTVSGAAKPGFSYPYQIAYSNDGTTTLNPNIVFNYDNTRLIYDSCSNVSVINTGHSLTLSEPSFVPGMQKNFTGYFRVNPSAVIGDSLRSGAHIISGSTAAHDSDVVAIRGSYDPNDKSATPALSPAQVINGDYIYYTIRFQNTGTDTAFSIVITDTLHNKLQPSTLQMIAISHPCITTVKNNTISFEFINIMLPDSNVNQLKSHGYISFRIKPINTLVVNDIVPNKAAIYFDYNSPVITNMATTTVVDPIVVPLKLLSFTVSRGVGQHANLNWQTNDEVNVKNYIVEMSTNGRTYNAVGLENAKGYQYNNYTKSIAIPADAVLYFRLKMMDIDGRYTYSNIAILKNDKANSSFSFLSNPVKDELSISLQDESLRNTTATIFNAQGIKVRTILLQHDVENVNIKTLPAGTYYLVTEKGSGQFVVIR